MICIERTALFMTIECTSMGFPYDIHVGALFRILEESMETIVPARSSPHGSREYEYQLPRASRK